MKTFGRILKGALLCRYADPMLLHGDDDGTNPGGGGGGGGAVTPPRVQTSDVVARYGGDTIRMAERLADVERDNFDYREKLRAAKAETADLKGRLPAEGAVVLTPDQSKSWEAYQKLGAPDVLAGEVESGKVAKTTLSNALRAQTLESAAKLAGFKPGLLKIVGKDWAVAVREIDVTDAEGKVSKASRAFVVAKNGEVETLTPLGDYAKAQGEDVYNSLLETETDNGSQGETVGASQTQNGGFQYPAQTSGVPKKETTYAAGYGANKYAHNLPQTKAA